MLLSNVSRVMVLQLQYFTTPNHDTVLSLEIIVTVLSCKDVTIKWNLEPMWRYYYYDIITWDYSDGIPISSLIL